MIFVTVGTHEQQFNRLVGYMDYLVKKSVITEEVFMQIGYCTHLPLYCKWNKLLPYKEMIGNMNRARIVVTHGGPASFIMALQSGKIPIVVPRQAEFGEHVNNHQIEFVKAFKGRYGNIVPVYEIEKLEDAIKNYNMVASNITVKIGSNNSMFNYKLGKLIDNILA